MTCVVTDEPFKHVEPFYTLKCKSLAEGIGFESSGNAHRFHASEDPQSIRDSVFDIIKGYLDSFSVYTVIIRKNKVDPSLREITRLYESVFKWLIQYIFKHEHFSDGDKVVIVTDLLPVQKKQSALRLALKKLMNQLVANIGITYKLYHHRSESDINLQVADYCCWAIQRKWEIDDERSYSLIKDSICGEGDLFENEDTVYYSFNK